MKKILTAGHLVQWPLSCQLETGMGDGFIFLSSKVPISANILTDGIMTSKKKTYNISHLSENCFVDYEFYAGSNSNDKRKKSLFGDGFNLDSYQTEVDGIELILDKIRTQESYGFKKVIIPLSCNKYNLVKYFELVDTLNSILRKTKKEGVKYYMTIPIIVGNLINPEEFNLFLTNLTRFDYIFDGYYLVFEQMISGNNKISNDLRYYTGVLHLLRAIKDIGKKEIIFGHANWDSVLFYSLVDIDYISIGYFETTRNFKLEYYQNNPSMSRQNPWYFSSKLLNFINGSWIQSERLIENQDVLTILRNENNPYSDKILKKEFYMGTNNPILNKNYILSIMNLLTEVESQGLIEDRKNYMITLIKKAQGDHKIISSYKKFNPPSHDYFYNIWLELLENS